MARTTRVHLRPDSLNEFLLMTIWGVLSEDVFLDRHLMICLLLTFVLLCLFILIT